MNAHQLGLPFNQSIRYTAQDFLITDSNKLAYEWVRKWPQWPSHTLIIWGAAGCGKTHLAHIWEKAVRTKGLTVQWLNLNSIYEFPDAQIVILENVENYITRFPNELFHLYNFIKEHKGFLLCTSQIPPNQWDIKLPDLSSRLLSVPKAQITEPDDELLRGILHKQFSDLQIHISPQSIEYIIKNTERSYAAIHKMVENISMYLQNLGGNVSISLIKKILAV